MCRHFISSNRNIFHLLRWPVVLHILKSNSKWFACRRSQIPQSKREISSFSFTAMLLPEQYSTPLTPLNHEWQPCIIQPSKFNHITSIPYQFHQLHTFGKGRKRYTFQPSNLCFKVSIDKWAVMHNLHLDSPVFSAQRQDPPQKCVDSMYCHASNTFVKTGMTRCSQYKDRSCGWNRCQTPATKESRLRCQNKILYHKLRKPCAPVW